MFEPIRGGTRGGQAEFKWSDVSADKDRENYLGHSINAPTGRWQKNKDVHWYSRDLKQEEDERVAEIKRIKDMEADALAVALGFEPAKKPSPGTATTATSPTSPTSIPHPADTSPTPNTNTKDAQRALDKEERRRRKAERKEERRIRKEQKRRMHTLERQPSSTRRYAIDDARGRDHERGVRLRSRSLTRSRSWSRTPPPPPPLTRRSASPRRRAWSPHRRSRSRSPPRRRPDSYLDTFTDRHGPARRRRPSPSRSPSLESSRSGTPPPRRGYEPRRDRRDDREGYGRDREDRPRGGSGARRELPMGGPASGRYYDRHR